MATFALHTNTPCPGNGKVSMLSGANHSIAVSVTGVGAVFAKFQVWAREDGGEPGRVDGEVTVSGTTTATQTVTFTGEYAEVWLVLSYISVASVFSATITTQATVSSIPTTYQGSTVVVGGVVYGWDEELGAYVAQRSPSRVLRFPDRGMVYAFGTSTTMRSQNTTAGISVQSYESPMGEVNILRNSQWNLQYRGQAGITIDELLALKGEIYDGYPAGVVLQLGGNDLDNTEASAEVLIPKVQTLAEEVLRNGIAVAIQTPHYNGTNWRGALHYSSTIQEWCASRGIPVIDGITAIANPSYQTGVAKTDSMESDGIHIKDVGSKYYGVEGVEVLDNGVTRRILPGGSAYVSSELHINPRMIGSTAVTTGEVGFSGTKPTNWVFSRVGTFAGNVVVSVSSDPYDPYVELSIPWGASNDYLTIGDATVNAALAAKASGWKFRHMCWYEIVTPGTCENVRTYMPFSAGSVQHPNGNSSNFNGVLTAGRRFICSQQYDTSVAGLALSNGSAGIRISASAAGNSVVRIRGISARESRW